MKPKTMILYTNRNVSVLDENNEQCIKFQKKMYCYKMHKHTARECCELSEKFFIAKFGKWEHEITREEMMYLLGVRTQEDDLKEIIEKDKAFHSMSKCRGCAEECENRHET